jgi:hypothetical protein
VSDGTYFLFEIHVTPPPNSKPILVQAVTERNVFLSFSCVLGKVNCSVLLAVEEKEKLDIFDEVLCLYKIFFEVFPLRYQHRFIRAVIISSFMFSYKYSCISRTFKVIKC